MEAQQLNAQTGSSTRSAGQDMALSQSQLDQLREYYGFDKPVLQSYVEWVGKVATGDLGSSYRYNEPVWDVIKDRFPVSLYYGLVTLVITYLVCIPLGALKAIKHRTAVDNLTSGVYIHRLCYPGLRPGFVTTVVFFRAPGMVSHGGVYQYPL